jgi:hypothetical protein
MKKFLALSLLVFAGCLKPAPTGTGPEKPEPQVQDQNLLAGATSSTNWPADIQGDIPIQVKGTADSNLTLTFSIFPNPVEVEGTVTLFKAGSIPALEATKMEKFSFSSTDTLVVTASQILSIQDVSPDSVYFSIELETDTAKCFMAGFLYSKKLNRILNSPFSGKSTAPSYLRRPKFAFNAIPDSAFLAFAESSMFQIEGKSRLCFYIPGSPYYWMQETKDSVFLGPLPSGRFPIRLLRVTQDSVNGGNTLLEVFEVILEVKVTSGLNSYFNYRIGERLFTTELDGTLSLRAGSS